MYVAVRLERGGLRRNGRSIFASKSAGMSTRDSWIRWWLPFVVLRGPLAGEREILDVISAPSEDATRQRLGQDNWHRDRMLTVKSIEP